MCESPYSGLRYRVAEGIAHIVLDRPPLNLIDEVLTREYHHALQQAEADPDCRVIILSGSGKGLSGGLDIKFVEAFEQEEMEKFLRLFYVDTLAICRSLSKPLITMVQGYAREGACTLAFAGDLIIAADDADFGYPAVPNLAGPPGMHVWFLQRLIGRMKAAELIYTGEPISALDASSMGLITKTVPAASLEAETLRMAAKLPRCLRLRSKEPKAAFRNGRHGVLRGARCRTQGAVRSLFQRRQQRSAACVSRETPPNWRNK